LFGRKSWGSLDIWSLGTLIFTLMSEVAVSIEMGKQHYRRNI